MTRCHSLVAAVDDRGAGLDRGGADQRVEPAERSTVASTIAATSPSLVTSTVIASTARPAAVRLSATCSRRLVDVGDDDAAPSRANRLTIASPKPGRATGHDDHADARVAIASPHTPRGRRRTGSRHPTCTPTASLARKSAIAATSSAVPRRWSGSWAASISRKRSGSSGCSVTWRKRGVSIDPGAMTLARTVGPYSMAICRVRATSPAFAAPYAA